MGGNLPRSQLVPTELSITVGEIVEMHHLVVEKFGGMPGIRVEGCVGSAIANAENAEHYSGNQAGTLGLCFIGSLMFYLNKNQCFMDGNKRTSLTVALKLLGDLGLTLAVDPKALELFCVDMATNKTLTSAEVVRWISDHVVQNH